MWNLAHFNKYICVTLSVSLCNWLSFLCVIDYHCHACLCVLPCNIVMCIQYSEPYDLYYNSGKKNKIAWMCNWINDAVEEFLYYLLELFNSTSTRDYTLRQLTFTSLNKDTRSMPASKSQRIIVLSPPFLFAPFFLGPSRLRIEVTYQRVSCRSSSDRHVSADFPIKPAEQLSIDSNQRLLSACPVIFFNIGIWSRLFTIVLVFMSTFLRLAKLRILWKVD